MNYYLGQHPSEDTASTRVGVWHRTRPDNQGLSLVYWLTVAGLGCLSLVAVTWGASTALARKDAGKPLLPGVVLPKLLTSHGERTEDPVRTSGTHPSEPAHPKASHPTAQPSPPPDHPPPAPAFTGHHLPTPETSHGAVGAPSPSEPVIVDMCDDPVVYLHPCASKPGDSPMIRNWKTLTLFSLLSAATVVYVPEPALAQQTEGPVKDDALEKRVKALEIKKPNYDELRKELTPQFKDLEKSISDQIKVRMDELNKEMINLKLKQIDQEARLDETKKTVEKLLETLLKGGPLATTPTLDNARLNDIINRLNKIDELLAKLGPTEKRLSLSMPNPPANVGRIVLVNNFSESVLFTMNGTSYRLPARTSRIVENLPAGTFRYEFFADRFGVLENQATTLAGGETLTFTVNNTR